MVKYAQGGVINVQNKNKALYSLVFTALLSALVFASNYISFPIGQSRIHVANAVCLLAVCCLDL